MPLDAAVQSHTKMTQWCLPTLTLISWQLNLTQEFIYLSFYMYIFIDFWIYLSEELKSLSLQLSISVFIYICFYERHRICKRKMERITVLYTKCLKKINRMFGQKTFSTGQKKKQGRNNSKPKKCWKRKRQFQCYVSPRVFLLYCSPFSICQSRRQRGRSPGGAWVKQAWVAEGRCLLILYEPIYVMECRHVQYKHYRCFKHIDLH